LKISKKMNVNKVKIDPNKSIFDVANDLGLDLSTLREFHNNNSYAHDWIREDFSIPTWTEWILIPDSIENLKKKKEEVDSPNIINLIQKTNESIDYKIIQKIDMQVSGSSMIDSETDIIWRVKKNEKNNLFFVDVSQQSHQVKYIKSMYRQLAEYMQRFNKPIEQLILELSTSGKIMSIENQDEIESSWKKLREILKGEMGDSLEEKNMLEGGDKDFRDTLPLIKNNILYHLFFNDVFYKYTETDKFLEIESHQYASQVFSNEKVNIITKRKVEKEGNLAKIKFYTESDPNKNDHLRNIYNSKLKDFLKEEFDYQLTWSVEYLYDIKNAKMISCISKIKEVASSKYCHMMEHNITINKN